MHTILVLVSLGPGIQVKTHVVMIHKDNIVNKISNIALL